jgi:hypothetical protein
MISHPIEPGIAALIAIANRPAEPAGGVRQWTISDLPPAVWRPGSAIVIAAPEVEPPPVPAGPCAEWLRVDGPTGGSAAECAPSWRMEVIMPSADYGGWGGVPPDIQIACSEFFRIWEEWRARYHLARAETDLWQALDKARLWVGGGPGRSLWLQVKWRIGANERDLVMRLTPALNGGSLVFDVAERALDATDDPHAILPVARLGESGGGIAAMQVVGRETDWHSASDVVRDTALRLASFGLETATPPLRALNDPTLLPAGIDERAGIGTVCGRLASEMPWLFLDSADIANLLAAVTAERVEAGERVLCVVPDDDALMDVAKAMAAWLPAGALPAGTAAATMLGTRPPAASQPSLEDELKAATKHLDDLAASAEGRKRGLAEGPFVGEGAANERMARAVAAVSELLPACLDGIDWREAPPLTGDEAGALRDLLTVPDCPARNLPPTEGIPPRAAIAELAERTHGLEDGQWLIAELLRQGPPSTDLSAGRLLVDRLERSVRAVEEAASVLPPAAVAAVLARLDGGLESLAEATLGATGALIDYARRTAGHVVAGVAGADPQSVLDAARRYHAALANPEPTRRWLRRSPSDQVPNLLRSAWVDGEPCTSVNQLRTLIEWAELELRSARASIPRLATDWDRALGADWAAGSPPSAFALHHLALLAREGRLLWAGIEHAATVFGVALPMDAPAEPAALWVRILRAFVDAKAEWLAVHQGLDAIEEVGRSGDDPLVDSLAHALAALDADGVERHRGAIAAYHEHRAQLARRQALIEQLGCAAPLWASRLRAGDPSAGTILGQFPRVWDLARVRAWLTSPEAAELAREEAEVEALARRREALAIEIRTARLREAMASAPTSSPPIRVILASGIAQAALLDSGVYDLVVYWASEVFAAELYAAIRFAERAVVIGTDLASTADAGDGAEASIGRLRDHVGLIRVEG